MDANAERMPGDAEALAAAQAMVDLYGRRLLIGEQVQWRLDEWPVGTTATGLVCGWRGGRLILDYAGELVEVELDQLLPF